MKVKALHLLVLLTYSYMFQIIESARCIDVWDAPATDQAGTYSCGSRITYMQGQGMNEIEAKVFVAAEFPDICGPCGDACDAVWDAPATDQAGTYPCGSRITYMQGQGLNEQEAKNFVASEFPDICGPCGEVVSEPPTIPQLTPKPTTTPPTPKPTTTPPTPKPTTTPPTPKPTTTPPTSRPTKPITTPKPTTGASCNDVWNTPAPGPGGDFSCGDRIGYMQTQGLNAQEASNFVACEIPEVCGICKSEGYSCPTPEPTPLSTPAPTSVASGRTLRVLSYNTEYVGYPCCGGGRVPAYGAKIQEVDAAVVGLQECQDAYLLASYATPYKVVSSGGNWILYDPNIVTELQSGVFNIPRDDYAQRVVTYAKFRINDVGTEFWMFNTHLPHNHNQAASRDTHAAIAQMTLDKRRELGAANAPTVITCDCNPFASSGSPKGSFESNLVADDFTLSYMGTGIYGGYGGLDKIFHSSHWTAANGRDHGTGSSDHPAITADLTLL